MKQDVCAALNTKLDDRSEGSALAVLWRNILVEKGIVSRVPAMIRRYLDTDVTSKSVQMKKKSKSSITNDVTSKSMSWRVFISLLKDVLKVKDVRFTVTLTFRNGEKSVHSVNVDT